MLRCDGLTFITWQPWSEQKVVQGSFPASWDTVPSHSFFSSTTAQRANARDAAHRWQTGERRFIHSAHVIRPRSASLALEASTPLLFRATGEPQDLLGCIRLAPTNLTAPLSLIRSLGGDLTKFMSNRQPARPTTNGRVTLLGERSIKARYYSVKPMTNMTTWRASPPSPLSAVQPLGTVSTPFTFTGPSCSGRSHSTRPSALVRPWSRCPPPCRP
jgi:hypothetical protein